MWEILNLFFREALFYSTLPWNVGLIQKYIKGFFTPMIVNCQSVLKKESNRQEIQILFGT